MGYGPQVRLQVLTATIKVRLRLLGFREQRLWHQCEK